MVTRMDPRRGLNDRFGQFGPAGNLYSPTQVVSWSAIGTWRSIKSVQHDSCGQHLPGVRGAISDF